MRQRNIPVTEKVATEVQTDVRLLHDPVYYSTEDIMAGSRLYTHLRQSQLLGADGLIRPQTESLLLSQLRHELDLFKGLKSLDGVSQDDLKKRLQWLESQIDGLEKRSLSLMGGDGKVPGYYHILGDLQAKLDRQLVISNNYEPKMQQLNERIKELETQVANLRLALSDQIKIKDENELLKDAFRQISDVVRDPKRMRDIERTVNQTLLPLLEEFDIKLDLLVKNTTVTGRGNTNNPQNRLKTQVNSMLKSIERLNRSPEDFKIENIDSVMHGFMTELGVSETFQAYNQGKMYKHMYEDLKEKLSAAGGIFKSTVETVLHDHPELKTKINIQAMDGLMTEDIQAYLSGNIIVLEPKLSSGRMVYYQTMETRTKTLLNLMARQFKRLIKKYPDLQSELGAQLNEILTLQIFEDAISLDEMQRIVEVVKYQPEIVKVENVYQMNNDKNLKVIFHLKIMIKTLLQQLMKLKDKTGLELEIDDGLLKMIDAEIDGVVDPQDVLKVFRSVPKILEVEKVVQKDLGRYLGVLTQAYPLNVESAKIVDRIVEIPVPVKEQVGLLLEKGVTHTAVQEKAVFMSEQKILAVPQFREKLVDRIVTNEKAVEFEVVQQVPIKQVEIQEVQRIVHVQRTIEVPHEVPVEIPYQTTNTIKQIVEVKLYEERLVEVLKEVTNVKEVRVVEQVPIDMVKYIEVEKIVNNFIKVPQIVEIKEQVPIQITNTIEKPVEVIEQIEKIVMTTVVDQRLVEVVMNREVPIVQEVPVPYKQEVIVTVKPDREEVILQVERIIEKPIIRETLQLRDVEIEKAVPVWLREEKPVIVQVNVPYIQNEPEIVTVQVEKMIPYKEEVPVEVVREVPVPIVLEKEVVKQVRVLVEKVVQKLVEVPRVVEVEKIVEKIVVVPRVIENIVHVPHIVQKIVEREVEVLKIVEIQKPIPIYMERQVKEIVPQSTPYPVEKRVVQIAEKEKIVVMKEETEVIKEVEVERRIPVEVIVQREVPLIQEKIVEKVITINDVQIRDRQVVIPFKQEMPVQLIQERAVEVRKIVENIVQVPQLIEKTSILYETKVVPEIHTVYVDRPIEVEKELVFTDTRNLIEKQIEYRDLVKEVLVKEIEKIEIMKPEPFIVEKIVMTNEIHEQGIEVKLEKGQPYKKDQLVTVQTPVTYYATKQVPRNIHRDKLVEVRTFIDQLKEVEVQGIEKIVGVNVTKPQVIELTQEVIKYIKQEVEHNLYRDVPVKVQEIVTYEVPGKTEIAHETQTIREHVTEPVYSEKIVERVILLPQIIEILKHVHDISEVHSMGIAAGVDIDLHTKNYVSVSRNLKDSLERLLVSIRGSTRAGEFNNQIAIIEELLPMLIELIRFPTIVQVPKQVQKIVQKEKIVTIPTKDQAAIDRETASTILIENLIKELKRLRLQFKIDLQLDEDIKNIFFAELKNIDNMDEKLKQFTTVILNRFHSLGNWTQQHSLMLNTFLQERFLMAGLIKEYNENMEALKLDLETEEATNNRLNDIVTKLNIHNITLKNSLEDIVNGLQQLLNRGEDIGASRSIAEEMLKKGRGTLDISKSDPLRESRYLQMKGDMADDSEKLRIRIRNLEVELDSYRGGQSRRNGYLATELSTARAENEALKQEISLLRQAQGQDRGSQERRSQQLNIRIEDLNRQLRNQQEDFQKRYKRVKEDLEKQMQVKLTESRMVSGTEEEDRLKMANRQLQSRVNELEQKLSIASNEFEKIKAELSRRSIEYEEVKRRLQESQVTDFQAGLGGIGSSFSSRPGSGLNTPMQPQPQMRGSQKPIRESQQKRQVEEQKPETAEKQALYSSPDPRGSSKFNTPAEQLKFQSPQVREVRTEQQPSEIESSSSRLSGSQQYGSQVKSVKRNVSLRQLMNEGRVHENIAAALIVKVAEKLQEETNRGRYMFYSPDNIHIMGYTPERPDQAKIRLGDPIDKTKENTRVYLPPEVLRGDPANQKSCVFNIAVIWDEMLHGDLFFKSGQEIQSATYEYKVRNPRVNAIFKNTLFEMMARDFRRRIGFTEVRRRLSLQHFIVVEEGGRQ